MGRGSWQRWRPFSLALAFALALGGASYGRASAPVAAGAPAAAVVEVEIKDFAFTPATLVIVPNTTVRWTNRDTARHDVYGAMNASALRSPILSQAQSFEYTFTLPGTYAYVCSLHAFMSAQVRVEASASFTFPETGFTVQDRFLTYWRANGLDFGDPGVSYRESLALFGLPISEQFMEQIGAQEYLVQYFERARFEYHPENADPQYQVLLGQFGRLIRPADPPATRKPGAAYFDDTGHNLDGRFRAYWVENGGLAVFGLPISEEFEQVLDGKTYRVQYFERARFEAHPENQAPYDVLLGQFGRQVLGR